MAYAENGKKEKSMFEFMTGLVLFTLIFTAASILIGVTLREHFEVLLEKRLAQPLAADGAAPVIVIDAGHGGEDGGCSVDGILEKDLNLALSENIYDICCFMGIPAKMTRSDDRLLYDMYGELGDYTGKKKTYDLKNRLRFASENGGVYLGIHMNKFPQSQYSGLQTYYSPNNEESRVYAEKIQEYVRTYIQNSNTREIKKADSSIFILSKTQMPAVLVECGFLSNPEELSLLNSTNYRRDLSLGIFCAVTGTAEEIE